MADEELSTGYILKMINLIVMIITTSGSILLFCLIAVIIWVQYRAKKLLPHLKTTSDGEMITTIGFFHPYCNAGGGGERVLWMAIKALYQKYPGIKCVVYTGDTDATANDILSRAKQRFNIALPKEVEFVYLQKRDWVEASPYPHFTLLCQSLGSLVLGWEAMMKFVPDVYIDTMGYAFTLPLFRFVGGCKVACYVHYPTISTDMLNRVAQRTATYNNARFISRSPVLSQGKLLYYKIFAWLYGLAGKCAKVVMVNSTWTQGHILDLWHANDRTLIVYPPCDTKGFLSLPLEDKTDNKVHSIVSVAQFRPEKDHPLQLRAFKKFLEQQRNKHKYKLILVGGCRNEGDQSRVKDLKDLATELEITDHVEFRLNVPFSELKQLMADATVGLHTMWNEHFGIGVVELMAAGTLTLAHKSGGPKLDIVVEHEGKRTGYLADSVDSYSDSLDTIFKLSSDESFQIRTNARESVSRFSDEEFETNFLAATEPLFKSFDL